MALPLQLTSAIRPFLKTAKVISPTGIAVLLSVGAHAGLLAVGPRTNFSFAALSQAAQEADAKETIVPLVQLTPAEQSRLPNFAQPRLQPPSATDFGKLSLPSGLPFVPNTSIPKARTIPTNPFPTATQPRTPLSPRPSLPRRSLPFPTSSLPPNILRQRPSGLSVLPNLPAGTPPGESEAEGSNANPNQNDRPTPSGSAADLLPQLEPSVSIGEALARAEAGGSAQVPDIGDRLQSSQPTTEEEDPPEATERPDEAPEVIAITPAQGNAARLLESYTYDDANTSESAVDTNTADWLAASASGKDGIATASASLTIDSEFKACLSENPPEDGLIGVVVNPDGTQEVLAVLKSTGYDLLNRQATDAVERNDFGDLAVPTQYQVEIAVTYNPSGCVESLPNETEE
ncbi:MAG: hypothetical protein WBB01_03470 [Phormidesmis sp.]